MFLLLDKCLVSIWSHKPLKLTRISHLNLNKPSSSLSRFINSLWRTIKKLINCYNSSRDGSVYVGSCLYRFDTSKGFTLLEFISDLWEVDEDNVSELGLCVVGDSAGGNLSIYLNVFMSCLVL